MKTRIDETLLKRDNNDICTANIHIETDEERYWKQVRVQAAIAAMQAFCHDETLSYEKTAKMAVSQADALVKELRQKEVVTSPSRYS